MRQPEMQTPTPTASPPPDASTLVSLIVVAAPSLDGTEGAILRADEFLQSRYAFYEILLITTDLDGHADTLFQNLAKHLPHVRLLQIEGHSNFDDLAAHGYGQAIGDVLLLSSSDELAHVKLADLLLPFSSGSQFVRLRRSKGSLVALAASRTISAITGFEADTRYYRTCAMNRIILSDLLERPDLLHLTRFTTSRYIRRQKIINVDLPPVRKTIKGTIARFELILNLIATSSSRILRFSTVICLLLSSAAFGTAFYPLIIRLLNWEVAEGWSSTFVLLSMLAGAQLFATATICLGMSLLLERQETRLSRRVAEDRSTGEIFGRAQILNVDRG